MRRYAAFLLLALFAGSAVAQDVTYTTLTVAYGKVRMKDGSYADIKGMKLPAKIERVKSTKMIKPPTSYFEPAYRKAPAFSPMLALQPLYWADQDPNNTNTIPYGQIDSEFDSCSVLDDIQVAPNAVNIPWQQLTFGMNNPTPHNFLIRWTVWNAYNANAPAGTSAFSPYPVPSTYLLDFGVVWPQSQTQVGPLKITLNIASAQVYAPQTQFWFSQQFRQYQFPGNPEAPFDTNVMNLFNHVMPPQVGFSDVFFWLDGGAALDGMYEEGEKDIFGDTQNPGQGNLLLKIEGNLSGTIQDCNPTTATLEKGVYISGDFSDLWFSDDFYYRGRPDWTQPRSVEPLQLVVTGRSPASNINSISFSCESGTTGGNATQKIQMYRYGGPTPGWVDVDTRAINTTDGNVTYIYTGANPQYFVNPTDQNRMMARVKVSPDGNVARSFNVRFDRCRWQVSTP